MFIRYIINLFYVNKKSPSSRNLLIACVVFLNLDKINIIKSPVLDFLTYYI